MIYETITVYYRNKIINVIVYFTINLQCHINICTKRRDQ